MSEHIFEISTSHFSFSYVKPKSLNIMKKKQVPQKVTKDVFKIEWLKVKINV